MSINIKVDRELSDEFVGDVLVTAFDGDHGGCWYWAVPDWVETPTATATWLEATPHKDECSTHLQGFCDCPGGVWEKVHVQVNPEEPTGKAIMDKPFVADKETVRIGIQRILDQDTPIRDDIANSIMRAVLEEDAGDIDSLAADCIIQAGHLGEIVFG